MGKKDKHLVIALMGILVFGQSCSTSSYYDLAERGKCEEASLAIPSVRKRSSFTRRGKQVVGHVASYPVVGTMYTVDVILMFTGWALTGVVMCSPAIAVDLVSNGNNDLSARCFNQYLTHNGSKLNIDTKLGPKAVKETHEWRCADFSSLTKYLRKVASCYIKRGNKNDLQQAKYQLKLIQENDEIYSCLDENEKDKIQGTLNKIGNV